MLRRATVPGKIIAFLVAVTLVAGLWCVDFFRVRAAQAVVSLPQPNQLLSLSTKGDGPSLKGVTFDPAQSDVLTFLVDRGSLPLSDPQRAAANARLVRYFLAGLVTPAERLWVNLSPYEPDAVIEDEHRATELGQDMLKEDYLLKMLASSLTHPDTASGKEYWTDDGAKSASENKVWIKPGKMDLYAQGNVAVLGETSLAIEAEQGRINGKRYADLMREVNENVRFADVRQMYRSLLLAMWFKEQLQGGVYATYRDTSKVGGIANQDAKVVPQIFKLYERSFDKGVYRVARKDVDGSKASTYFSGGIGWQGLKDVAGSAITLSRAKLAELTKDSRSFDTVHVSCSTLAYGSKGAATSSSLSVSSPDLFPVLPVSAQDALIDQAMLKSYAPRSDYNGKDVGLALDAIAQPRCTVKQRSELLAFVRRYKPVDFFGKKAMSREVFFKTIALMKRADGEAMDAASRESLAWLLHMSAFWSDTFTKASLNSEMVADLVSLIRRMQGNETIRHKLIQVLYLTGKRREALAEAALDRTHVADIAALMQDAQGGDFDLLRRFFVATYATQPAIRDHLISLGSDWAAILNGMPQDWAGQYYDSVIETYSTVYSHRVIGEVFVDQVGTKNISQKKSSVLAMQLKRARYVYEKDLERSRERLAAMPPWQRYMMQAWSRFTRKSMVPKFTFDLEKDPALLDPITKGTEAFYKLSWVDFVKGMDDHSAQKAKTQGGSESDAAKDFDVLFPSLSTAQEKALIAEANDLKSNGKMKTAEDVKKILRAIALPIRPDENGMDAKTRQRLANVLCWMAAKSQIHSGVIDGDIVKSLLALISLPDGSGMDEQTRQKLADALYWMAESNQIPSGEIDKDMVKSLLTLIFLPDGSGMDAKTRHHLAGVLLEMAKNNKIPSAEIDKDMVESLLALISLPDGSGMDAQTRQDLATALYWMVHKNQIPSGEIDKDMVESFLALISLPDGSEMNAQTRSYLAEAMGVMFRDPAVRAAVADLGYEWGVVLADLPAGFYEKIGRVTDAGGNSVPTDVATKLIELILAQALLPQNDQKQSSLRAMQLKRAWYRHEKAVKAAEENKQPAPEFVFDPVTAAPIEEGTEALYKLPWNTFVTQMSAHESDNQIVSKRDRRVYDRESLEVAFVHASHMNDGDGRIALADGLVPAEFVSEMFDALFYFDVRKTPQGINYARAIDQFFKAPVSLDYRLTVDQAEDSLNLLIDERVTDSVRDYFSNVWKNYVLPAFPVGGLAGLHLETFISLCDAFHGYSLYDSQELAFAFFNEARIRALFAGALSGDQFNRLAEIVNTTSNAELKTAAGRFLAAEYMRSHALRETLRQSQHEWAVVLHEMPEAFFPQAAKIIERADAAYDVFADMTTVSSKIPNEEARGAKVSMQLKRAWYRHEKAVKAAEENKQPVPEFVFDPEKNQVDAALIEVGTEVFYKLPWADFVKGMDAYAAKGSKADAQESAAASKNDKDLFPVLSDAEQDALIARVRPLVVTQDYDISSDEIAMLFDALVLPRCSVDDQKAILTFMQNSVQSASWETLGAYEFDKFISYLSSLSMRSNVDFEIRTAMTILQNLAYYDVFSQRSITYAQLDSLIELLRIHEHSWIDSGSIAGTIWMMLAQNSLDVSVFTASDIVRLYEFAVFLSQTHVNRENDIDERRAVAGLLLQMISTRKDLLESFALSQSLEWPLIVETMPIDFKTGIFREALRSEAVAAAVDFEFLPPLLDAIVSQYSKHSSDQEETNVVFMYLKRAWYRHEKAVEAAKTAGKPVPEFVFDLKNSNDAALIEVGTEAFYKLPWADFVKGMDEYFGNAALVVEPVNTDAVFSAPDASRYAGLADYVYVEGHPTEMFFSFWKEIVHDHTELQYGLSVDLYNKICTTVAADPQARIEGVAPRYVTLIRSLYEKRNGILPALTDEEAHTINTLSVDVGRAFDLAKKKGRIKLLAEPTFRTTVRQFVEVFSKYYLQDRTSALDHVFEYFMLTAWTVYGRMLTPDSRREFASVMQEVFRKEKYEMLFVRSSVSRGGGFEEHQIDALFDHGRFDAVGKSYVDDGNEPQTYDAVRAAVSRAESAGMTACVKVPSGYQIPDAVYRSLSATGADVISVSMGGFTQTADLFGRNAFDKDGNPQWVPGKIEEALAYAQRYPEKKVYFLLESPEDAPPHVLTSLHSLLLEHTFKPEGAAARERGEQRIPPNMQVVLVQSAQAQIDDPAFVDRSAAYTLSDVTDDDLRRFIAHETNDQEVADAVIAARTHFSKVFPKIDVFSEDLLFVARNGALRHASGEAVGTVVAEEMFMHFAAKHAAQDDALRVKIAVALGLSPQWKPRIELARTETGWMLNAQGVQVPVDPTGQFGAYLAAHPEVAALGFAAALAASRGEDYFVTDTEVNVMTLLARAHISGNAVLLQGASGEGKTTVNRVFMDIAGRVRHEMTINAETDKNLFESAAMITHQGVRLRESDFERAAKSSGQGFLFNEADTQPFIFSYLRPQIMQRDLQKNMYVFTGNIRDELPLSIARALACTYRVESSDVDTKQIAQRLMERECGKTIAGQYTDRLYAIFKLLRKAALDRETESHREVTRRELGRFAALFAARMRAGDTPDDAFAFATEIIFVRMWQTDADMQFAREIAQANNVTRWPTYDAVVSFVRTYRGHVPMMTVGQTGDLFGSDEVVTRLPLSRFHTKSALVGGLGRTPSDSKAAESYGVLPQLMLAARLDPVHTHRAVLDGYLDLHPDAAPLFNEFFPTGELDVSAVAQNPDVVADVLSRIVAAKQEANVIAEYNARYPNAALPASIEVYTPMQRLALVTFALSIRPKNLLFAAVEQYPSVNEPDEGLHPADIDRFMVVNLNRELTPQSGYDVVYAACGNKYAAAFAQAAVDSFSAQHRAGLYPHMRFSFAQLDAFAAEVKRRGLIDRHAVAVLAWLMLGNGLLDRTDGDEREDYLAAFVHTLGIDQSKVTVDRQYRTGEKGRVELVFPVADEGRELFSIVRNTAYVRVMDQGRGYYDVDDGKKVSRIRLQAPLPELLVQQSIAILAEDNGLDVVFEGDPGGGKTTSLRDLSRAEGRSVVEEPMSADSILASLLGGPVFRDKAFHVTSGEQDASGAFVLPFLRAYTQGGRFIADEGACGENADHVLRWISRVAHMPSFDLGTFVPGMQGTIITRSPEFRFAVTQNLHFATGGRRPVPGAVDGRALFAYVPNVLTQDAAETLIRYYADGVPLSVDLTARLARVHILLSKEHPQKRMLSPRDLIDMIALLGKGGVDSASVHEALRITYVGSLSLPQDREKVVAAIATVFPGFSATGSRYDLSPKQTQSVPAELAPWLNVASYRQALVAYTRALSSQGRQVLLIEPKGGNAVDFLKVQTAMTGSKLEVYEGHPQLTSKNILAGAMAGFAPDTVNENGEWTGKRKADGTFVRVDGLLGKHLVKESDYAAEKEKTHAQVTVALTNVDAISPSELVKMNELLTTGSIMLPDEQGIMTRYMLPSWVSFVPIVRNIDEITSPFANRFRRMSVPELSTADDAYAVIAPMFPNVTKDELAFAISVLARASDVAFLDRTEVKPAFSFGKIFELATRVQMYKQQAVENGSAQDDPLYFIVRAIDNVMRIGLYPNDAAVFDRDVMVPSIVDLFGKDQARAAEVYFNDLQQRIAVSENAFDHYRAVERRIDEATIARGYRGVDGIEIARRGENMVVITGAMSKVIPLATFVDGVPQYVSHSLSLTRNGDVWILRKDLVAGVGAVSFATDPRSDAYALSPDDAPKQTYMSMSRPLRRLMAATAEAGKPIIAANGTRIAPRMVYLLGEAGTGKSSIPAALSGMDGAMYVRINPHRDTTAQSIGAEMSIRKEIEMNMSEFLASVAKVNGKPVANPAGHAQRVRVMIDEANITKDAWYLLDAIARGEKDFVWLSPSGEPMHIEMEKHVEVIMTANPAERFGGLGADASRFDLPESIDARGMRVYVGDPLSSYSPEEQERLLDDLYARGSAQSARSTAIDALGALPMQNVDTASHDDAFAVHQVQVVQPVSFDELRTRAIALANAQKEAERKKISSDQQKKKIEQTKGMFKELTTFDEHTFVAELASLNAFDGNERAMKLIGNIFPMYVRGLSMDKISDLTFEGLLRAAGNDTRFADLIRRYRKIYAADRLSLAELQSAALSLKAYAEDEHRLFLEDCKVIHVRYGERAAVGITYAAVPIADVMRISSERFDFLGELKSNALPEGRLPRVIRLSRGMGPDSTLGYFDGSDVVQVAIDDQYEADGVAYHEIGHYLSDNMAKYSPDMRSVLHNNVETYSMLSPIVFLDEPMRYIKDELLERISKSRRDNDPYVVASLAIFRAFDQVFGYDMERRLSFDKPDLGVLHDMVKRLEQVPAEKIRTAAQAMFLKPLAYFGDMPKTMYQHFAMRGQAKINGQMQSFELGEGLNVRPSVETVTVESENDDTADAADDDDNTVEKPSQGKDLMDDATRRQELFGEGISRELPKPVESLVKRFEKIFAPDKPKAALTKKYVSEGGVDIDIGKYLEGDYEHLFLKPNVKNSSKEKALNLVFAVDTSGSMRQYREVIENAFLHYAGLAARLGQKNKDLTVSLVGISGKYDLVVSADDWRSARSLEEKRMLIAKACDTLWAVTDGAGINTDAMLDGLASLRLPMPKGRDVFTQVIVLTDGQETNGGGASLQKSINEFLASRNTRGKTMNVYDMAFFGIGLSDKGVMLRQNYPAFANFGADTTGLTYLQGLLETAIKMSKGERLQGNLAAELAAQDEVVRPTSQNDLSGAKKQPERSMRSVQDRISTTVSSALKGGIDWRGIARSSSRKTTPPPADWRSGGIAISSIHTEGRGEVFVDMAQKAVSSRT